MEHILSEKNILECLDYPNIVSFGGSFQSKHHAYIVLECVNGGEFYTHLYSQGSFDDRSTKFYAAQVVNIFEYLHSKGIIYRDLKPENLLIDTEGYLKMTDFGFAKYVKYKTYTLCGTPEYIAPEVSKYRMKNIFTKLIFVCFVTGSPK